MQLKESGMEDITLLRLYSTYEFKFLDYRKWKDYFSDKEQPFHRYVRKYLQEFLT